MKTRAAACAGLLALTAALTACGSSDGDTKAKEAACKVAKRKSLDDAMRYRLDHATRVKEDNACKGLNDEILLKLDNEVAKEAYEDDKRNGLVGTQP
ncbi:hypothetical protein [Streptomyces sp. NRRL S-1022]|uniref:hypothetical protein n=1 Tax=Streptomyces sp. NRRL S-1022 TaxID=1463880 RepID=UPI00131D4A41|nr:hypothetical protein [Streptomyces sp. NRRL S-1022]